MQSRYSLVVEPPVVAKIDSFTGEVWVANSGVWRQIEHPGDIKPALPLSSQEEKAK
jgi:hypothetical protein